MDRKQPSQNASRVWGQLTLTHSFSVQGERYFSCRPSYGGFVRPEKIKVGDYPPLDLELEDDEM